jgi:peptidoglycan/xylan/chitin deacetylase (PgdA/CDA1 family)
MIEPLTTGLMRVLRGVRRGTFSLAERLKISDRLRSSEWRRQRLMIACYHGVSIDDEHDWDPLLYLRPETLRARCHALRRDGYAVLGLGEAARRLYDGTLPPASVVLTFDDGTHDFRAQALPILREFDFPVTVYVSTSYSRFQRPVFDVVCSYIAWKARAVGRCSEVGLVCDGGPLLTATAGQRAATVARLRAAARSRKLCAEAKDAAARDFATRLRVDYDRILDRRLLRIMCCDEIAEVQRQGVDVQLHTHRHRSPHDAELFAREIRDNRAALAACGGVPSPRVHFCYPSGASDPALLPLLRANGITTATTCVPGLATRSDDPLLLPRFVDAESQDSAAFDAWSSGLADLLPRRRYVRVETERGTGRT